MDRIAGAMAENSMEIKRIDYDFSVCKVEDYSLAKLDSEYCFIGKQMKKIPWYVLLHRFHLMLRKEMMDGRHFVYRGSLIFP